MSIIPERDKSGRQKTSEVSEFKSCIEDDLSFNCETGFVTIVSKDTETPLLLLDSVSRGGKTKINYFCASVKTLSVRLIIKIYGSPTVTADGTLLSNSNLRLNDSPNTSTLKLYKSPTVSANGALLKTFVIGPDQGMQRIDHPIIMNATEKLLLTCEVDVVSTPTLIDCLWAEFSS